MDTASVLCLPFVAATILHLIIVAVKLAKVPDKSYLAYLSWNTPRVLTCLVYTALAAGAMVDIVYQAYGGGLILKTYRYEQAVTVSAAVGSLAALALAILRPVNIWQALYAAVACANWTLMCILLNITRKLVFLVPGLYLLALLAILCTPHHLLVRQLNHHPLTQIALLPAITLSWMDPLLKRAASGLLTTDFLWPVIDVISVQDYATEKNGSESTHCWNLEKGLIRTLALYFPRQLLLSGFLAVVSLIGTLVQPFLLRSLLQNRDYLAVAALFAASIAVGSCDTHAKYRLRKIGLKMRSVLTADLCDRELTAPKADQDEALDPSVLIEVDLPRIFEFTEGFHLIWMVPLQVCISTTALVYLLGWKSLLVGSLVPLLLVPMLSTVMGRISLLITHVMEAKDARVSRVTKVLKHARQIKMAALDVLVQRQIGEARERELSRTKDVAVSNAAIVCIIYVLPTGLVYVCFATYAYFNGGLDSEVIFPALAFFFNINRATALLPNLVMLFQSAKVSFNRVRSALSFADSRASGPGAAVSEPVAQARVAMPQCSFADPGHTLSRVALESCNMDIRPGSLIVVTGPVGSLQMQKKIAYASQKPFLINGTIRENILFGSHFDAKLYSKVLYAVGLGQDLLRLPHGDATVLGGTAVALSGGQMSRVALARAVYSCRDVLVLDDPLAPIDGQVRQHIVDNVLGRNGMLKGSIRIVSTSAEALMQAADKVFVISHGTIKEISPPQIKSESSKEQDMEKANRQIRSSVSRSYGSMPSARASQVPEESSPEDEETPLLKKLSLSDSGINNPSGASLSTYARFLRLSHSGGWAIVLIVASISKLLDVIGLYCLKLSSEEFGAGGYSNKLTCYIVCGMTGAALSAVFVLAAYFLCLIPASRQIHAELAKGVLESKFTFFDNTPLGQIINRFTNDINKVDGPVGGGLIGLVAMSVTATSSILVIIISSPFSLFYLVPIGIAYYIMQSYYLHACRQLRRLENAARGPILNIAGEIKTGADTISIYGQARMFKTRVRSAIDGHIRVWGPFLALDIWLMLRLQVLSSLIQLLSACLLLANQAPSSTLGLTMNFIIQITVQFNTLVQLRANLEADITSAERVWSYAANPPESDGNEATPPTSWPQEGSIVFDGFTASYAPGASPCLDHLALTIEQGENVAIVGRTGAGKSSIALALLRALDPEAVISGEIRIDGLDISEVNLQSLRKRVSLVPQEPAAFDGTLRYNLDPKGTRSDGELLEVIETCHVRQVFNMGDGIDVLDYPIASESASLSAGQAQIIALARAILEKNKIVILDEATAAMDAKTRNIIQTLIRQKFKHNTLIAITHHLDAIMDYDKVLILDSGRVAAYGAPAALLADEEPTFMKLVGKASASVQVQR
ncbi:hypothetical protein NM208_g6236 [Fusarium decemcellulare]|uniref:Uncharacterized protein n=1 Tax=Fusarium decemcellulare TaxID=57161 RepID=A0ACC1SDR4_9HYPO|nr:hypothetical protein NM208_g6236 [Fusarium decemcellulare]